MRKFSSYGPPNNKLHYYVPKDALIASTLMQLKGQAPDEGGHYITVWAPRQTGKTWIMREVVLTLERETEFDVVILSLQFLAGVTESDRVAQLIARELGNKLPLEKTSVDSLEIFISCLNEKHWPNLCS
jgi:hypothetical protein